MVVTVNSSLEAINSAIREQNPFAQPPFVQANHIWNKGFPDIESLNAHASDAVFKALDEIQAKQYSTTSLLITAQNGTGKSHIVSRIRHRLKQNDQALFVFANQFNDLNEPQNGFQNLLAVSLGHEGSQGIAQWQKVASKIAHVALKKLNPQKPDVETTILIEKFTENSIDKTGKWIQRLSDIFCQYKNVQDPEIIKAILWCLSDSQKPFAANWLAGKELAQYKANELRLPSQRKGFDIVLQILDIISQFYELLICFDELDKTQFNDQGLHKSQIVAGLVKDLFENMNRGLILSTMMPGTWNERVKQLPGGVWNKMTAQGKPYELKHIDEISILELVRTFLQNYYKSKEIVPPHSFYPFDKDELQSIGRGKPTIRETLIWCRDNCLSKAEKSIKSCKSETEKIPAEEAKSPEVSVNDAFDSEFEAIDKSYWEQNKQIGDALLFSFQSLTSSALEGVEISEVTAHVKYKGRKDSYMNFKIIGVEKSIDICIGVAVLQDDGGKGLGAGFKRLLDKKGEFNITRGCLVRSQEKPLNRYFKFTYLKPLIESHGGEWVDLKRTEIEPLIAIHNVYRKREEYNLTEEQIFGFIINSDPKLLLGSHSPLIQEILSNPTHQVPDMIDAPELENVDPEKLLEQPTGANSTVIVSESASVSGLDILDKSHEEDSPDYDDLVELTKDN